MVIMTAKMAVLRLTNGTVEVRVMRAKIRRKLSDQDPSHVVLTDEGPKDAEEAIRQGVMQELQAMRRRMDELISVCRLSISPGCDPVMGDNRVKQ